MKTPGVDSHQAKSFHSKLWQLHIDSTKGGPKKSAESDEPDTILGHLSLTERLSSRDPDAEAAKNIPFKERLRPGMVVSWKPSSSARSTWIPGSGDTLLGMLLCPAPAAGKYSKSLHGETSTDEEHSEKWVLAAFTPGTYPGSYDFSAWRHVLIGAETFTAEVFMEFDSPSRYYYRAV